MPFCAAPAAFAAAAGGFFCPAAAGGRKDSGTTIFLPKKEKKSRSFLTISLGKLLQSNARFATMKAVLWLIWAKNG